MWIDKYKLQMVYKCQVTHNTYFVYLHDGCSAFVQEITREIIQDTELIYFEFQMHAGNITYNWKQCTYPRCWLISIGVSVYLNNWSKLLRKKITRFAEKRNRIWARHRPYIRTLYSVIRPWMNHLSLLYQSVWMNKNGLNMTFQVNGKNSADCTLWWCCNAGEIHFQCHTSENTSVL
jgi:hypothetical protein